MKNDNAIYVMFEELKISLTEIKAQIETSKIEQKNNDQHKYEFDDSISKMKHSIQMHVTDRIMDLYNLLKSSVEIKESVLKDYILSHSAKEQHTHKHVYIIDLKSSKIPIIIASLGISLLISMITLFKLYEHVTELEDNNWKYRFVKAQKGIDKQGISNLEHIFHYDRNDDQISNLKEQVLKYESSLEQKAQNLEKYELSE